RTDLTMLAQETSIASERIPTVTEMFAAFVAHEMPARAYSADTRSAYSRAIRQFLHSCANIHLADHLELESVQHYQRAIEQRGLRMTSVRIKIAAVKAFIRYLEDEGILPIHFSHHIALPIPERAEPHRLSLYECTALLNAAAERPRDRALLAVLL